jgi:hypothetical protein
MPLVAWSRVTGTHATVDGFSNSIGVSMPSELWRRWRLWKISRSRRSRWPARPESSSDDGSAAPPACGTRTPRSSNCHSSPRPSPLSAPGRSSGALGERPRSELHSLIGVLISPAGGVRFWIAMPSALVTSAAVGELSMDQPTTRREKVPRTTAQ